MFVRGECRDKERERREQTCFQVNDDDSGKDIDVERGRSDRAQRVSDLFRRRAGHLPQRRVNHSLFAQIQHQQKRCAHHQRADRQQQKDSGNFPEHVFEAGHRLGENGVNGAVFDVLRKQPRGGNDCQQRGKNRDRAERNVFQDLKFLLKRELRHEDRAADQKQREDQQDVKTFRRVSSVSVLIVIARIRERERAMLRFAAR